MTTVVTTHIPIRPRSRRRRRDPIMHTVIREHDSRFQSVRRTAATETVRNSKRCRVQSSLRSAVSRRPAPSVLPLLLLPHPLPRIRGLLPPHAVSPHPAFDVVVLPLLRPPAPCSPAAARRFTACAAPALVSVRDRFDAEASADLPPLLSAPCSCWRRGCVSVAAAPASAPASAPLPRARGR